MAEISNSNINKFESSESVGTFLHISQLIKNENIKSTYLYFFKDSSNNYKNHCCFRFENSDDKYFFVRLNDYKINSLFLGLTILHLNENNIKIKEKTIHHNESNYLFFE